LLLRFFESYFLVTWLNFKRKPHQQAGALRLSKAARWFTILSLSKDGVPSTWRLQFPSYSSLIGRGLNPRPRRGLHEFLYPKVNPAKAEPPPSSLHQNHLLGLRIISRFEFVEIDTARYSLSPIILAIPYNFIGSTYLRLIHQNPHQLSTDVVYL
jgi:hypothetical protein